MTASTRYSRRGLYLPFLIAGLALLAWTGWWFLLAHQVEARLAAQKQELARSGWVLEHRPLSVSGWPFRARLDLRDVSLTAPSGHVIAAPRLLAEASAWAPFTWVGFASDGLMLERPGKGRVRLTGQALRFSAGRIDQDFPDLRVQLHAPVFTAEAGAEAFPLASAELIHVQARPHTGADETAVDQADLLFRLIGARGRTGGPVEAAARSGVFSFEVEAVASHLAALGAADPEGLLAGWGRAGGTLTALRGRVTAGDRRADFSMRALSADADGRLRGAVSLDAVGAAEALAALSGNETPVRETPLPTDAAPMKLEIVFRDGRSWLGPFPFAPAPKLF